MAKQTLGTSDCGSLCSSYKLQQNTSVLTYEDLGDLLPMRKSKLQYDIYIMVLLMLKITQDPSAPSWFIEKFSSLGYKYGIALFFQ